MFAKKNLVAAAALLAIAGAAQAQVKVYGTLDVGFGSIETAHAKSSPVRTTQVTTGTMMTSFIGFSAAEDLGGGLKVEATLESFLNVDNGEAGGATTANKAGGFWSRGSNVALSGGFGKVALGQYDNPLFTSAYTYNPFGSSMVLSPTMRHLNYVTQIGQNPLGSSTSLDGAGVGFDTGWVNSITYESPSVQGFSAALQYAPKETANGGSNSYTASGSYKAGPISATLTYVKAGDNGTDQYSADEKVIDLGVSFDAGAAKVFAQYTSIKDTTNANKDKIYQVGVSVPVSDKLSVLASYGQLSDKPTAGGASKKDTVFTVGADYLLSTRTDVYAAFMNNKQSNTTFDSAGQTIVAGIKHNF